MFLATSLAPELTPGTWAARPSTPSRPTRSVERSCSGGASEGTANLRAALPLNCRNLRRGGTAICPRAAWRVAILRLATAAATYPTGPGAFHTTARLRVHRAQPPLPQLRALRYVALRREGETPRPTGAGRLRRPRERPHARTRRRHLSCRTQAGADNAVYVQLRSLPQGTDLLLYLVSELPGAGVRASMTTSRPLANNATRPAPLPDPARLPL